MAPSLPSIGRQAKTRIRKEVQKGMTQVTKSTVWMVLLRTNWPMKRAAG